MVFEINLLPEKYRKRKLSVVLDARSLGIVGGVILAALLAWLTVTQGQKIAALEVEVDTLDAQKLQLEPQAARVRRFQDEIQTLNNNIATLQGLGQRNGLQLMILEIIDRQMPDNVWYRDINEDPPAERGRQQAAPQVGNILNLTGIATRKEGVTALITRLKSEDLFMEISTNFIRPFQIPGTDQYVFEFSLMATLSPISLQQLLQQMMEQAGAMLEEAMQQMQIPPR
jgi:Tfp pilus assembly protein PilN